MFLSLRLRALDKTGADKLRINMDGTGIYLICDLSAKSVVVSMMVSCHALYKFSKKQLLESRLYSHERPYSGGPKNQLQVGAHKSTYFGVKFHPSETHVFLKAIFWFGAHLVTNGVSVPTTDMLVAATFQGSH